MHTVMIGGSDAGISAALRAREVDPGCDVTAIVADAYPNFSICGIPYYVSGEVTRWQNLAHRTAADLEAAGITLCLDTTARRIDPAARTLLVTTPAGAEKQISYDQLVIGTGAVPARPPISGLDSLGPADGVHLLHSMDDTFAVMRTLEGLGTQVVKIFDQVAARTGLRDHEAAAAGFQPVTIESEADDHKAYYPGSHRIHIRLTGDQRTGQMLGMQLFGHRHAEIAKRIDTAATAIYHHMRIPDFSDLDLSYTPPLGSPWEALQIAAQAWDRATGQLSGHDESASLLA
ncbi:MAG TPA: FAD-dependent oxidoreductase [Streptosporangiaceae bacterium]|nr:FAD-dependent oxidoreductase [Streptosporangiaceae bacterium]